MYHDFYAQEFAGGLDISVGAAALVFARDQDSPNPHIA